jgi:23S rRNA pseudouridine1911/1915/1917 synthase
MPSNPIEILFSDEHLLVANKPAGLLSVPAPRIGGRTLAQALALQGELVEPVHRLDRDVSGCVLCARTRESRGALEDLFRERRLTKIYWALAQGEPKPPAGEIKFPIAEERAFARVSAQGKPALTRYRTSWTSGRVSEMEIELVTGRYNQIRLHFAHAGWPLCGERKYARGSTDPLRAKRVALHAWKLAFEHPWTHATISVEAPLAADLVALRERAAQQ